MATTTTVTRDEGQPLSVDPEGVAVDPRTGGLWPAHEGTAEGLPEPVGGVVPA